jgi:hypothetical protein
MMIAHTSYYILTGRFINSYTLINQDGGIAFEIRKKLKISISVARERKIGVLVCMATNCLETCLLAFSKSVCAVIGKSMSLNKMTLMMMLRVKVLSFSKLLVAQQRNVWLVSFTLVIEFVNFSCNKYEASSGFVFRVCMLFFPNFFKHVNYSKIIFQG